MAFHERLMQLRKERGWSQEQLADQLGVTRQTVSKWELGSTTPEMQKLMDMSALFGISIDELVGNEAFLPPQAEPVPAPAPQGTNGTMNIAASGRSLGCPLFM